MKTKLIILAVAVMLSGCGARVALTPEAGTALPQKPATAAKVPTADQLITADTQSRPERSDEQLRRSEKRQDDKFDLPPTK